MSRRLSTDRPFSCVTCEIEIVGPATFHVGLPFCCAGCVAGGPCICSYDRGPDDSGIRNCLDIEGTVGSRAASRAGEAVAAGRH